MRNIKRVINLTARSNLAKTAEMTQSEFIQRNNKSQYSLFNFAKRFGL